MLVLILIGLMSGAPGCDRAEQRGDVVARFEGGLLTVEDLAAHYAKMKKDARFRKNPEQLTPEFAFEHAVNMEMIIAKGLKENLHLDPRIRAEIHAFMADLFLKLMQEQLVPRIDKQDFSDKEVRAYFDAHPESYQTPARYDVRIIRSDDKQLLERIREDIADGVLTFEAAARAHSSDDRSRGKGGVLGPRPLERFRPEWRQVIAGLAPGSVSLPAVIGDHWYLFHLAGRTEPVPHDFEEREAFVRNDLLYARYQKAWQATYERLKKEFDLEVDEDRLAAFLKGDDPA